MGFFKRINGRLRDRLADHYMYLLLDDAIRLSDVPLWIRRDPLLCKTIYISAFRADRNISRARYDEDLLNLEVEIALVEAMGDCALAEKLNFVRNHAEDCLKLFEQN